MPVTVAKTSGVATDVAVRVQAVDAGRHVSVASVDYTQEIIGGLHGAGCAKVAGVAAPKPVAAARHDETAL